MNRASLVLLALSVIISFNSYSQRYTLDQHSEFLTANTEIPIYYLGHFNQNHYMLFWTKSNGLIRLVQLTEGFIPTSKSQVVGGVNKGDQESIVSVKIVGQETWLFTRTYNSSNKRQHFFIRRLNVSAMQVIETKEISSGYYTPLPGPTETPYISFYRINDRRGQEGEFELNYTERITKKMAKYHIVSIDKNANISEKYTVEIPHGFLSVLASRNSFDQSIDNNDNDVYKVFRPFGENENKFSIYKNDFSSLEAEIPIDLKGYNFSGGEWWIDSNNLFLTGYTSTNNNYGKVTGFLSIKFDLIAKEITKMDTIFLSKQFIAKYNNSRKPNQSNLYGLFDRIVHLKNGDQIVFSKLFFEDYFFARIDSTGAFAWTNQILATNIKPINKEFSKNFTLASGKDIILPMNSNCILIRNGHLNEFDQLDEFKNPKKKSDRYSINLYEVNPEGEIYTQILTNFEGQTRHIIHPDFYWQLENDEALLFSINSEKQNTYRFMSLTLEKER